MKKITSLVLVCALLVCCIFTLASCTMRFGKYESEISILGQSYTVTVEFSFSNVKVTEKTKILGTANTEVYEGTFEITGKGDDMEISFKFDGDAPTAFGADAYDYYEGEDDNGKYIKIGMTRYDAVD